jgi:hypothetical protein
VSTCLQDNPRPDTSNIPTGRSFGPPGGGSGCPPGIDPYSQRSYLPPHMPDYHARPGPEFFFEQEIVFRMIVINGMAGSIIGKGGSTICALQSETGASIKILEPIVDTDEHIVAISAREVCLYNNNNNNQTFYSQASWGRLQMKPHKNRYKTRAKKKGKTNGDKKIKSKKGEKIIKR